MRRMRRKGVEGKGDEEREGEDVYIYICIYIEKKKEGRIE